MNNRIGVTDMKTKRRIWLDWIADNREDIVLIGETYGRLIGSATKAGFSNVSDDLLLLLYPMVKEGKAGYG